MYLHQWLVRLIISHPDAFESAKSSNTELEEVLRDDPAITDSAQNLNASQVHALRSTLSVPLSLIWGPPGL